MLKRLILVSAFAALAASAALAADIPTKAPPLVPASSCTPNNCSGWYAGVNLSGVMTNANVIGNGLNGSLAGGGQSIGIQGGYQFASSGWFFGPEVQANYVVTSNQNISGSSKYRVGEYVKVGTALSNLIGLGNAVPSPGIPTALASSVISPYLLFGAVQSGIGQGWATGAGVEFAIAQGWFVDTRYTYNNYGSASVSPTVVAKSENLVTVGLNRKF